MSFWCLCGGTERALLQQKVRGRMGDGGGWKALCAGPWTPGCSCGLVFKAEGFKQRRRGVEHGQISILEMSLDLGTGVVK